MPYIGRSEKFGVRNRFYYTQASGGATSISGNDDAGKSLSFTDGAYVDVALNGVTLVAGTDYNTTTANTIAGLSALSAGDSIEILVYDVFNVADTVSATSGGTFTGGVTMGGTLAVTGAATLSSTLGVTGKITSTAGITFGSDTAAANVLDDYEEGTWTPQDGGGTDLSSVAHASYSKVGRIVTLLFDFTYNTYTSSNPARVLNLPFTAFSAGYAAGTVSYNNTGAVRGIVVTADTATLDFTDMLTAFPTASTKRFIGSVTYFTA